MNCSIWFDRMMWIFDSFWTRKQILQIGSSCWNSRKPHPVCCFHDHMICRKKKVSLAEVVREPFVLTEKSVSYRYDLEQLLAEKAEIHPFLETGNTDILVRILLHGNCLSFLPQYVVRPYLLSGKMQTVDVEDCRIQMWSQLVYHKNKWVTPQMNCFITLMKEKMGKVI